MNQTSEDRIALDAINQFYQLRQTVPDAKKLSDNFGVTLQRAQELIEEFLTTNGNTMQKPVKIDSWPLTVERPASQSMPEKKEWILSFLIDTGSLGFAVAVDLVLNGIGFWIIGPDPIMKIGMVCVSVIVVLFSVRAWIKQNVILWAMFALVASFMDSSFILLATDVQSQNGGIDTELTRLADNEKKAQGYLDSLRGLQLVKGEGYRTQIQDAIDAVAKAHDERLAWMTRTRNSGTVQMTASKVFTAIPDAILSARWDRWIALALCVLVFTGLQLTIISATGVKWRQNERT